jgi:cephalosporin-C deacetylase-like acetyl esterase
VEEGKSDFQYNNMREYLIRAATSISDDPSDVNTLIEWEKIKPQRYKEFLEMMGIDHLPMQGKRTDLNITLTGVVKKEGYRIEKLYYQSLPGLYVRANLYIPDDCTSRCPAILYASGHTPDQKGTYQAHPSKFAQLGFVCMITETIQFGEVRGEHWGPARNGWFNWYSRGYNPGGVELWNAIRAIDLLTQRPDVDPDKIGVTGISGGGAQSWYIAAADPRIKAAAPVCGASTLKDHVLNRTVDGHCDCMMPNNIYLQDFRDIGALIAPRPLLIAQSDQDGMYRIEAVRDLAAAVKNKYTLYGKPDNVSLVETPGGHSYHKISRENIFSFFVEHLKNEKITPEQVGDIDSTEKNKASYEELKVYVNGPPKDDRTTTIQHSFIPQTPLPIIQSQQELHSLRNSVKNFLREKTFRAFPKNETAFDKQVEFTSMDSKNSGNTIYNFITEEGWRLKVDLHWRNNPATKKPLMIVLRNYDEERWSSEAFSSALDTNSNIAYFEVRGIGETGWDPSLQWHIRRAAAWAGRTVASMQVYDVLRCIRFVRTLSNVDSTGIGIAAQKEMGAVALYAALMDGRCNSIVLKDPPSTQDIGGSPDGKGPAIEMLNCLRITDVNQLPAFLSPAKISIMGEVPTAYEWSEKMLKRFEGRSFSKINSVE